MGDPWDLPALQDLGDRLAELEADDLLAQGGRGISEREVRRELQAYAERHATNLAELVPLVDRAKAAGLEIEEVRGILFAAPVGVSR